MARAIALAALLVSVLLLPLAAVAAERASKGTAPDIGYSAPNFELTNLAGTDVEFASYQGKVILLNFWATWCGPCRIELPAVQALADDYRGRGFQVVTVAGDSAGVKKVKPFMEEMALTLPTLIDADGNVADMYRVRGLPMTFLIDKNGVIVNILLGYFDWNDKQYRDLVDTLLAEL